MYTEIIIKAKSKLPDDVRATLIQLLGQSAVVEDCLPKTIFSGNSDFIDKVIYSSISNDKVFLVFQNDIYTLRIHIETINGKDRLELLQKAVDDTFTSMRSYWKDNKLKIDKTTASVYSESAFIIKGEYTPFWKTFWNLIKKDLTLKIYVPVVTLIISYMMNRDVEKSIYNAIIAVGASVVWIIIETVRTKTEIKYSLNK